MAIGVHIIILIGRTSGFINFLQLLAARGVVTADAAQSFLDTKLSSLRDPEELPGLPQAADRIHAAIEQRRQITIYGDYDADGMTSTALLLRCLSLLGAEDYAEVAKLE